MLNVEGDPESLTIHHSPLNTQHDSTFRRPPPWPLPSKLEPKKGRPERGALTALTAVVRSYGVVVVLVVVVEVVADVSVMVVPVMSVDIVSVDMVPVVPVALVSV